MSQVYTDNVFQEDHNAGTDLQNMENNFAALKSLFSGTSTPSNVVAGMPFFDTTNKILKIRNQANSAWLGVVYGSTALKIWVYANSAGDGMVVDSSITDKVIAIKGGSTYVTGGTSAGTWTQPNHTHTGPSHTHSLGNHVHQWFNDPGLSSSSQSYNSSGSSIVISYGSSNGGTHINTTTSIGTPVLKNDYYTSSTVSGNTGSGGTGATGGGATASTYRPAAAVGTIQYPNV